MTRSYAIAYGRQEEHAAALKRGLAKMAPGFTAELCPSCAGKGSRTTYSEGCEHCDGVGLCQGVGHRYSWMRPAPLSVVNQVLVAGDGQLVTGNIAVGITHNARRPLK